MNTNLATMGVEEGGVGDGTMVGETGVFVGVDVAAGGVGVDVGAGVDVGVADGREVFVA